MFRTATTFDKYLDKATSHMLMEADWQSILQICDLVRQNDVQPKYVFTALRKKLFAHNPHTAYFALEVLESLVKNCGAPIHDELTTKANCDMLLELAKKTAHENVRPKLLELIQTWNFAFRKNSKHSNLKDLMNILQSEGFKFPILRESDAMFMSDSAPAWSDGDVCHRCRVAFGVVQRKHHCRACGQVFCGQCSQKSISLPKFGIEKEVRVCDACYDQEANRTVVKSSSSKQEDNQLPAEYLSSSLAQQSQLPPRKSEEELREEEEFNLALALSQSEAEAKEKEKLKGTTSFYASTSQSLIEIRPKERSPSPPPEEHSNPELIRYLNRSYWENRKSSDIDDSIRAASPSAPATTQGQNSTIKTQSNGISDIELNTFIETLKSQVEIFINRMKSNSSRGRSIACDSSVQTLFMNITAMHSQLLRYIQQHDDQRLYYERLQDKLTQIKDARAALDALREEHRDRLRKQAEEAERQRQLQMAHKLEIMRKKKQEYLQYQRQLALQRIQEQEREMKMRQEQQQQQYMSGSQFGTFKGPLPSATSFPPGSIPYNYSYSQMSLPANISASGQPQPMWNSSNVRMVSIPANFGNTGSGMPPGVISDGPVITNLPQQSHGFPQPGPSQGVPHPGQGLPPPSNQNLSPQGPSLPLQGPGLPPQSQNVALHGPGLPHQGQGMPHQGQALPQQIQGMPHQGQALPQQVQSMPQQGQALPQQGQGMPHQGQALPPQGMSQQLQGIPQMVQGRPSQMMQGSNQTEEAQTGELISFD